MKTVKYTIIAAIIIILAVVFLLHNKHDGSKVILPNGKVVIIQVAESIDEQKKGLSGRTTLGVNEGMLFIFNTKLIPNFWMKDMLMSIDIIWISDNKIVDLSSELVPESYPDNSYSPQYPVNSVLEVNAGFIKKNNLKVGDMLDIVGKKQ